MDLLRARVLGALWRESLEEGRKTLPRAHEIRWASADRPVPVGAELATGESVSSSDSRFFALAFHLTRWQPPPSPLLALCTFLVAEKHAGDRSPWKPYLEVLPKAYTCAACLEPEVVALLPAPLEAKAREQRTRVRELFASSRGCFSSLRPLLSEPAESVFSYSAFLWAWCTVNTRAVYLKRGRGQGLSAEPDTCALAPYLDLLNHSPAVQVRGCRGGAPVTWDSERPAGRGCSCLLPTPFPSWPAAPPQVLTRGPPLPRPPVGHRLPPSRTGPGVWLEFLSRPLYTWGHCCPL